MIDIDKQELKIMIDDLKMIEDDVYTCLYEEPKKNDRLNGTGYMTGRLIRILEKKLENINKVWYNRRYYERNNY